MRSARPGRRTALLHSHYHNAMPRPVIIMTPRLSSPLLSSPLLCGKAGEISWLFFWLRCNSKKQLLTLIFLLILKSPLRSFFLLPPDYHCPHFRWLWEPPVPGRPGRLQRVLPVRGDGRWQPPVQHDQGVEQARLLPPAGPPQPRIWQGGRHEAVQSPALPHGQLHGQQRDPGQVLVCTPADRVKF